jgi:hypothetical protein
LSNVSTRNGTKSASWRRRRAGCHMDPAELLHLVAGVCERLGLPYLVTGSTATIYYGEPRFTNDIDIVVQLPS